MSGNTLGLLFTVTTFGESHGPAIGAVVDGCPPGMLLSEEDLQVDLDRRKPGTSRHVTQRKEEDKVDILSGVFEGKTTGTPIALLIRNTDHRSQDYGDILHTFRPGHADYAYHHKYGLRDPRGGGRSSARLTAPVVAAAAIAKKWLKLQYGTEFYGYMSQLGHLEIPFKDVAQVHQNPFFAANNEIVPQLEAYMDELRKSGDSCGAKIEVRARNAVKGVEIGSGFRSVAQLGSEHGDELHPDGFATNNSGGTLGGISSGQDLRVSIAIKPTSSIHSPKQSIDIDGKPITLQTKGRHDPCVGIRATPIAEAMLALVLMDHALRQRAQCGDVSLSVPPIPSARPGSQLD